MRLLIAPGFLLLAACAAGTGPTADGPLTGCNTDTCFMQRDIRDFEVVDDETLVVYAGTQRCAFLVELRGAQCRMSFAPEVSFVQTALGALNRPDGAFGREPSYRAPERVCAYTRSLAVLTGPFDALTRSRSQLPRPRTGPAPIADAACDVVDIRSLTDDELLELYVDRDLAPPPPPVGAGEIEVGEPQDGL